ASRHPRVWAAMSPHRIRPIGSATPNICEQRDCRRWRRWLCQGSSESWCSRVPADYWGTDKQKRATPCTSAAQRVSSGSTNCPLNRGGQRIVDLFERGLYASESSRYARG